MFGKPDLEFSCTFLIPREGPLARRPSPTAQNVAGRSALGTVCRRQTAPACWLELSVIRQNELGTQHVMGRGLGCRLFGSMGTTTYVFPVACVIFGCSGPRHPGRGEAIGLQQMCFYLLEAFC